MLCEFCVIGLMLYFFDVMGVIIVKMVGKYILCYGIDDIGFKGCVIDFVNVCDVILCC